MAKQFTRKVGTKSKMITTEDDDCLVNILEREETLIEANPALTHSRQHMSTENLYKETLQTIDQLRP